MSLALSGEQHSFVRMDSAGLTANAERFSGFADLYDRVRPQPPPVLRELLLQLAQTATARFVVDLGAGTGLSTRFWASAATDVVGLEPSADMRNEAARRTKEANVRYQAGYAHDTGLPDAAADIVTCSQSLHWMEPQGTFRECARILRAGGVFAAYDCDWPPTTAHWEADAAFLLLMARVHQLEAEHGTATGVRRWEKQQHLDRMQASGCFRFTKEVVVHHVESGNAERLVGIARSQGGLMSLLKHGLSEANIGLDELRAVAQRTLGDALQPWYFSYRVRVGIK
jgi:ubiquinone/menaquinone biosynthesis C-methylase UbiE